MTSPDPTTEVVAGVLRLHEFQIRPDGQPECRCHTVTFWHGETTRSRQAHRAHVAPALAAALGEREREGREEAWDEGYEAFAAQFAQPMDEAGQRPKATNPYRGQAGSDE